MKSFEEYQVLAAQTPLSLRNNRDRMDFLILGLQEETGKIGSLLGKALASGRLDLTQVQRGDVKERLSDVLWYVALLCGETGIGMQEVVTHNITRLQERTKALDPERR